MEVKRALQRDKMNESEKKEKREEFMKLFEVAWKLRIIYNNLKRQRLCKLFSYPPREDQPRLWDSKHSAPLFLNECFVKSQPLLK